MAPRPGLEPGTYGLTEQVTPVLIASKLKICNEFCLGAVASFPMPNHRPNLWRLWWSRCLEKSNMINELPKISVELVKTERADRTSPNRNWAGCRPPSGISNSSRTGRSLPRGSDSHQGKTPAAARPSWAGSPSEAVRACERFWSRGRKQSSSEA